jgi:hypothetical protein
MTGIDQSHQDHADDFDGACRRRPRGRTEPREGQRYSDRAEPRASHDPVRRLSNDYLAGIEPLKTNSSPGGSTPAGKSMDHRSGSDFAG